MHLMLQSLFTWIPKAIKQTAELKLDSVDDKVALSTYAIIYEHIDVD